MYLFSQAANVPLEPESLEQERESMLQVDQISSEEAASSSNTCFHSDSILYEATPALVLRLSVGSPPILLLLSSSAAEQTPQSMSRRAK